jgi:hypothetical protein
LQPAGDPEDHPRLAAFGDPFLRRAEYRRLGSSQKRKVIFSDRSARRGKSMRQSIGWLFTGIFLVAHGGQAQNLVTNGGFDHNTAGWNNGPITFSATDALGKPGSGSARFVTPGGNDSVVVADQCVPVTAGVTYRFGVRAYIPGGQTAVGHAGVWVHFYPAAGCLSGRVIGGPALITNTGDWFGASGTAIAPAGTQFAKVGAEAYQSSGTGTLTAYLDDVSFGVCVDTPFALCLDNQRFQVSVGYKTSENASLSPGQAVPLRADSGLFWFFNANNLELLVKVLDGCGLNQRHWVFFAATTNVGYTLTVTDTSTGAVKTYTNPLNTLAQARADTDAFAGCP